MNNPEDYASDTDSDDCDFDPNAHDSHAESEEEEDDNVDSKKASRKKKTDETETPEKEQPKELPEEDKKKADDLWASFQDDVKEEKEKPASENAASSSSSNLNLVKKPPLQTQTIPQRKPPTFPSALKRPASGGLGNILSQLGKKNKLSVLEQSKKDWNSFKDEEGLKEELATYNKGKDG